MDKLIAIAVMALGGLIDLLRGALSAVFAVVDSICTFINGDE